MKWLVLLGMLGALALWFTRRTARTDPVPQPGQAAPEFTLPDQNGQVHGLREFVGKWLVLYFYPKDDTPGCTRESCAFRDDLQQIADLDAQVIGISVDDAGSHARFARKYHLPFLLLADHTAAAAASYGVLSDWVLFRFARRHTFLIDPQGKIVKVYDKVDTSRHSKQIIEDLYKLQAEDKA